MRKFFKMAELLVDAPLPPSVVEDFEQLRNFIQRYEKRLEHDRKVIESQLFDHLPVAAKSREIRVDPLPLQLAF